MPDRPSEEGGDWRAKIPELSSGSGTMGARQARKCHVPGSIFLKGCGVEAAVPAKLKILL